MAPAQQIRNPVEWGWAQLRFVVLALRGAAHAIQGGETAHRAAAPAVGRLTAADLREALRKGLEDFAAYRTDVVFLCLIYPVVGLVLSRLVFGYELLALIFPLASGFVLLGPLVATGLYEMSRRREQGAEVSWADAFAVAESPAFGAILALGLLLIAVFLVWLLAAYILFAVTLGPAPPASLAAFTRDVLTTGAGWTMIVAGMGIGLLFAVLVLTSSLISFPLLLDRDVGLWTAVATSLQAARTNPGPVAAWGLIVAGGLFLGSIPALLGLVVVLPVLGHGTWHLYRKLVPR